MVRKALYITIPYLIGFVCCSLIYDYKKDILIYVIMFSIIGTVALIKIFKFTFKKSVLCATSLIIGFLIYSNYRVSTVDYIINRYNNQDIIFTGKVIDFNDYSSDMSSYIVDGTINEETTSKIYLYITSIDCSYGDTISFKCTLTDFTNDYLFNTKQYYNSKGIYLETYSISDLKVTHNFDFKSRFIRKLNSYRNDTISIFKKFMSKDGSSMLSAILFGDKSDLAKDSKNALNRSGISHMIAVSGLHLAILTSMLDFILKLIDRFIEVPKILNFLIYEIFSILFVALVGFPISAVRTLIMLSISKSAILFVRQSDILNTLSLTTLIMITTEPYLINNVSFLLSISGVFGIGVFSNYILKDFKLNNFIKGVISTVFTTICVFPISIL